jgi:hypothetical protein
VTGEPIVLRGGVVISAAEVAEHEVLMPVLNAAIVSAVAKGGAR